MLVHRPDVAEQYRGQQLLAAVSETSADLRSMLADLPIVEVLLAREMARHGDRDRAIPLIRKTVDRMVNEGRLTNWGVLATGLLAETLLDRKAEEDIAEADATIGRLTAVFADGWAGPDILLVRLRALLARAQGNDNAYRDYRDRYRKMANELGFEGHMQWAEEMP